jgi:hypothetical protein
MKMQDTISIEGVDGEAFEVTCTKLEPVAAYELLAKVGKLLVPAVMAAQGLTSKSDALSMIPAVNQLFDAMSPELARSLMQDLLRGCTLTRPDDKGELERHDLLTTQKINRAFRGNLKAMLMAMKFSLEVNFGDFFAASAAVASTTPTQ